MDELNENVLDYESKVEKPEVKMEVRKAATLDAMSQMGFLLMIPILLAVTWSPLRKTDDSVQVIISIIPFVPFFWDWTLRRSWGMMFFHLHIRNFNVQEEDVGNRIVMRAFVKNFVLLAIGFLVGIDYLWGLGDYWFGVVVKDVFQLVITPILFGCFLVQVFGYANVMKGERAFHDWISGTRVGE